MLTAICGVAVSYVSMGLGGYMAYGSTSAAPMTKNLGEGGLVDKIGLLQAVLVMVSFPLQCYPLSQMADEVWPDHPRVLRFVAVTIPTVGAIAVPFMAQMMGIIGGLAMTLLGCVFPYSMYLAVFGATMSAEKKYGLGLLLAVAATLGVIATLESVLELIKLD